MRAVEAGRPDSVIDDPQAVRLLERIDFPFEERFGPPRAGQWQALRARAFDDEVSRFLAANPGGAWWPSARAWRPGSGASTTGAPTG
jgi:O-methyltransferase involved in polyketide biosynthesis